jgi:O-antigen/teichoic acid export membrane protein
VKVPQNSNLFSNRIFSAYATSILGIFGGLFTQLVFVKKLINEVSIEQFSLYTFVYQIIFYFSILQLGLDHTTGREIAHRLGKGDLNKANYSFWFLKNFNLKVCLVSVLAVVILAVAFNYNILLPKSYDSRESVFLLIVFSISQLINFFSTPFNFALIGSNLQHFVNLNSIVSNFISTIIAFLFLVYTNLGIYSMPLALIFTSSANYIYTKRITYKKCFDWISTKPFNKDKVFERHLFSFSLLAVLGGLAWTVESTSDIFILSSASLFSIIGVYSLWWRFPQMLFDFATRLTVSATPTFSSVIDTGSRQVDIFEYLFYLIIFLGLLVTSGIAFLLPSFMKFWVGKSFLVENYSTIASLIAILIWLRVIGNYLSVFVFSIGAISLTSSLAWLQAFIKVLLGIYLTALYGLSGLFFSSIIATTIQVIGTGIYLFRKKILNIYLFYWMFFPVILFTVLSFFTSILVQTYSEFILLGITILLVISFLFLLVLYLTRIHVFRFYLQSLKNTLNL